MSDDVQIALIVALAPVLVQVITHWISSKKLDHITVLTNSTLTKANERIDALEKQLKISVDAAEPPA